MTRINADGLRPVTVLRFFCNLAVWRLEFAAIENDGTPPTIARIAAALAFVIYVENETLRVSFNVSNLLAHALEFVLQLDDRARDFKVVGLAADRVHLAADFLQQKF